MYPLCFIGVAYLLTSGSAVKTQLWKETSKISKQSPLSSGRIEGWKCYYCDLELWNRNAARLQFHLCGDSSLRNDVTGFNGVDVCKRVPEDVSAAAKAEMKKKTSDSNSSSKRKLKRKNRFIYALSPIAKI